MRAQLLVAAMDLKAVRSVRAAIRAADISAGGVPGPLGIIVKPGPAPHGASAAADERIESRPVIHPTPRFESRPVIHVQPRLVQQTPPPPAPQPLPPAQPEQPTRLRSPIQPPWRVLPWQTPVQPAPKVKVVIRRPDIVSKGSLIDFFI